MMQVKEFQINYNLFPHFGQIPVSLSTAIMHLGQIKCSIFLTEVFFLIKFMMLVMKKSRKAIIPPNITPIKVKRNKKDIKTITPIQTIHQILINHLLV